MVSFLSLFGNESWWLTQTKGAGGGLGHIAVQLASKGFGYRVIGIDHSSKRDLALQSGAEHFFAIDQTSDMAAAVKEVTKEWMAASAIVVTCEYPR